MTAAPGGSSRTTSTRLSPRSTAASALGAVGFALRVLGFLLRVWAVCGLYLFHFMMRPWWTVAPMFAVDTSWIPRTVRFPRFPRPVRPAPRPYGDITIVDQDNIAVNGGNINAPIGGDVNYHGHQPPGPPRPGPYRGPRPMPRPHRRR